MVRVPDMIVPVDGRPHVEVAADEGADGGAGEAELFMLVKILLLLGWEW